MKLLDLINRTIPPEPWVEGEKIPWHDAEFSKRMLKEHLSQAHNAASRRMELIDLHVDWISTTILSGRQSKILDLGCGPGLYTERLAKFGHSCVGIDYAPGSIAYARQQANEQGLDASYIEADVRNASFGKGYSLVMMIHGELNVFRPSEIKSILNKSNQALNPGGAFLAEVHTLAAVREIGETRANWYSSPGGLFSTRPHIYLHEAYWNATLQVSTERYYVVDTLSMEIEHYAASIQAYDNNQYHELIRGSGFEDVTIYSSLTGEAREDDRHYLVIVAKK